MTWLGVDVGWVFPAADSDGNIYEWTRRQQPREPLTAAGPVTIRRLDGTTFIRPAYDPSEAAILEARDGEFAVRGLASSVVAHAERTDQGVALEDWSKFQQRKKAWMRVYTAIASRAETRNVPVVQVNRAYTSITCPKCDHKSRANRATRSKFTCVLCGFTGHADVVAAMNIARRAEGTFRIATGSCVNEHCHGPAWKDGACIVCYRFRWRTGRLPTVADLKERAEAPSSHAYRQRMREQAFTERQERRDAETRARLFESWRTHDALGRPKPLADNA